MKNEGQKPGRANGFIPSSVRAISSYLRIVSSGASTVASTVRSAASSIVDRDHDARFDQVLWAGFDKFECGRDVRQVLLLGYRSGFQVWDVEEAHNVHDLVSRYDGPVSFLQMLPKPGSSKGSHDKFSHSRPLVVVCTDGSLLQDVMNAHISNSPNPGNGYYGPSTVRIYSLTSQTYVHVLKFRSVVHSVRCSARIVAISQASQVHCFNAATMEKEYTIVTNPVVMGGQALVGVGYGPLALGPRWLAYSGSTVEVSNAGRVCPQHLTPSATFPSGASNGSCVAHYAKESSKNLASGIVTLGDKGYKKLSHYCSELLPDSNHSVKPGVGAKANSTINGHLPDIDHVGMVIVKDVVSKAVITQFRAHKSPISALCFDPSGVLLVTASVQGHNINVFRIMPGCCGDSAADSSGSFVHLYRLQRGLTNALIQDIAFSNDSCWIMISSSRGTNHLFAISPFGGNVDLQFIDASLRSNGSSTVSNPVVRWQPKSSVQMFNQHKLSTSGPPVTLSAVSRIRNGSNGWKGTVNGVAAVATGKNSSMSGAIATTFYLCKGNGTDANACTSKSKYHLLVFTPGSLIQYALRVSPGVDAPPVVSGVGPAYEGSPGNDLKLMVEATQKWNICQKPRELEDNFDIYGENGSSDNRKVFHEETRKGYDTCSVGNCMTIITSQTSPEERNHFYISEAELQMHEQEVPLWLRSEIYFESMITDGIKFLDENFGGEIEIEKVSTRTIEVRSKGLVPVYDYLNNAKSQAARVAVPDDKCGSEMVPQESGSSQNGNLLSDGNPRVLDWADKSGSEYHNGNGETINGIFKDADATTGFVYNNECPRNVSHLQNVNSRDRELSNMEAHLKLVNNCNEALKMENQFEAKGEGFG